MPNRKFLLRESRKDPRDLKVSAVRLATPILPPAVDLRPLSPPIYDQGAAGLCFAHAGCRAFDMDYHEATGKFMAPSRLFLGIMTRYDEGTLYEDAGATMRGTCKAMARYGICPESQMPYDIKKMYQRPGQDLMASAEKYQALKYFSIGSGDLFLMKQTLAAGHAIMFGARIYESFQSADVAKTGVVPMPASSEQSLGGHALTCVGYSDERASMLVANSWGDKWGFEQGHCWMPYTYFTAGNLVFDIWVVTQTELGN